MGSEAADLGRLGGHRPIQNRSDNKPQQSFFRQRQKGLQCTRCGHDNLAGDKCKVTGTICHKCGSKLNANSGFWQIPLSETSRPLTTFITPFGRYHFNKLPFGISCAPELLQRRMNTILEGLGRMVSLTDDVDFRF